MIGLTSCSTIRVVTSCDWADENLLTASEASQLSEQSKRNIIEYETNYNKFCK